MATSVASVWSVRDRTGDRGALLPAADRPHGLVCDRQPGHDTSGVRGVFGPTASARLASASASTPLSAIVSAQSLANNGMSNWTVGDFRSAEAAKLGPAANQLVLVNL